MKTEELEQNYKLVKQQCNSDAKSDETGDTILRLVETSLKFLKECKTQVLTSKVKVLESNAEEKHYEAFQNKDNKVISRPFRTDLFLKEFEKTKNFWGEWKLGQINRENLEKLVYTVALAPCLAMELFNRQNKKGPATFFECYVSHLFSRALDVNPSKRVKLNLGNNTEVSMTMDFIFEKDTCRVHLPVKMSSRERVVQAWAHQRILDVSYNGKPFLGIMVLFSETKLNLRSLEVVEICVPGQWLAYQKLLSRMHRIYYFDIPSRYKQLSEQYSDEIAIKQFTDFFIEKEEVLRS